MVERTDANVATPGGELNSERRHELSRRRLAAALAAIGSAEKVRRFEFLEYGVQNLLGRRLLRVPFRPSVSRLD